MTTTQRGHHSEWNKAHLHKHQRRPLNRLRRGICGSGSKSNSGDGNFC